MALSGLLISGILNVLCVLQQPAGKRPHSLCCAGGRLLIFLEPDECCSTWELLQLQNIGSFATCSLPASEGGLWVTAVHQLCAMWLLWHIAVVFLALSVSVLKASHYSSWRGEKPQPSLFTFSWRIFQPAFFFFFKMQALDPRMNFFAVMNNQVRKPWFVKKMGHLGFQVCGSLHFAARLHSTVLALPCEPQLLSTSGHLGHLLVGDQETDLDSWF